MTILKICSVTFILVSAINCWPFGLHLEQNHWESESNMVYDGISKEQSFLDFANTLVSNQLIRNEIKFDKSLETCSLSNQNQLENSKYLFFFCYLQYPVK